ncbi:MAG: type II toxin-antitoxin system RelB/DinJ family antitoxin [Coriobacteriia bacterium]|nr:type II toxin-antitoxin system RelB/DinJ family antitoxin [Coriobacteriia bacterium]
MATTMVNFRMDEGLKKEMDKVCKKMGLTATSAFTLFATKLVQDKRIPFEIVSDPFYSKENMDYLKQAIEDVESGKAVLEEHDLIEVD